MKPASEDAIQIGRLLRAGTSGFVVGCRVSQLESPAFGGLVRATLSDDYQIYGLIHDIHIDDDGLVRQLVTAEGIDENVIADNRLNRNVPLEMSVLSVGYSQGGRIYPPAAAAPAAQPGCDLPVQPGRAAPVHFGGAVWLFPPPAAPSGPAGERAAGGAFAAGKSCPCGCWRLALGSITPPQELITFLSDDYATLMSVLSVFARCIFRR